MTRKKKETDVTTQVQETQADTQPMMTLADIRRLTGKSQDQVAQSMGVARSRVSTIEQDYPNVTYPVVQSYFRALGVRIQYAVPGGGVVQETAVEADPARDDARQKRLSRLQSRDGRLV